MKIGAEGSFRPSDFSVHNRNDLISRGDLSSELNRLQEQLDKIGEALHQGREATSNGAPDVCSRQKLVRDEIRRRANRLKHLPSHLLADPAWDMLLDLYSASLAQLRVTISSLCRASNVPPTTALRWIKTLETEGLITRQNDPLDARRYFVELTEAGLSALESYFADGAI